MKSFQGYLNESRVKWLKMPQHRSVLLLDDQMVGTIEFYAGTPEILPDSKDRYTATLGGTYRDTRLKVKRTVFRTIGTFDTEQEAKQALVKAAQNSKK